MVRRRWVTAAAVVLLLGGCGRPGLTLEPFRTLVLERRYAEVQQHPTADLYLEIARTEAGAHDWVASAEAYQKAIELDPANPGALTELAGLKIIHGDVDEALQLLKQCEEKLPNNADVQAKLGDLYNELGQREFAVASYHRALDLDPNELRSLLRLASYELQRRNLANARQYLARLKAVAPARAEVMGLELELATRSGDDAKVESMLRGLYRDHPSPASVGALRNFLLSKSRWGETIALCDQWLAKHPDDVEAALARAAALRGIATASGERSAMNTVRRYLQRLTGKYPQNPLPLMQLASVDFQVGLIDAGIGACKKADRLCVADTKMQLAIADLLAKWKQHLDADEMYRRIAQDDPELRTEIARRRALNAQEMGVKAPEQGVDPVEANYIYALRADSNDVVALNNLAFHYAENKKNLDAARKMSERAIAIQGQDPNLLDTLAWVLLRSGETTAAQDPLAKALAALPDDPAVHYHRAVMLEALKDRQGALAAAQKALRMSDKFIGREDCQQLVERLGGKP